MWGITAILVITLVYCALKWFACYVSSEALISFMLKNEIPTPTREELDECREIVLKGMLKMK